MRNFIGHFSVFFFSVRNLITYLWGFLYWPYMVTFLNGNNEKDEYRIPGFEKKLVGPEYLQVDFDGGENI